MQGSRPVARTLISALAFTVLISISLAIWTLNQRNQLLLQFSAEATARAEEVQKVDEAQSTRAAQAERATVAEASAQSARATAAVAEAVVQSTALAYQATATAAVVRATDQAKGMTCDTPIDIQALTPQSSWAATPSPIFAYAVPFDAQGTGPFSLDAGRDKLFHYRPASIPTQFSFVRCLFLQASISSSATAGPAALDFGFWSPFSGAWDANGGKNRLDWGDNTVAIQFPNDLVSRQGDVYFSMRNYGTRKINIDQVNLMLWLINPDDTETIIKPSSAYLSTATQATPIALPVTSVIARPSPTPVPSLPPLTRVAAADSVRATTIAEATRALTGSAIRTPAPLDSFQLIDLSWLRGEIDIDHAAVFRVYALFGIPSPPLPAQYISKVLPKDEGTGLFLYALKDWDKLSPATQRSLADFVTPRQVTRAELSATPTSTPAVPLPVGTYVTTITHSDNLTSELPLEGRWNFDLTSGALTLNGERSSQGHIMRQATGLLW